MRGNFRPLSFVSQLVLHASGPSVDPSSVTDVPRSPLARG